MSLLFQHITNTLSHVQQCLTSLISTHHKLSRSCPTSFGFSYLNTLQNLSLMSNSGLASLISTHRKLFYSCPTAFCLLLFQHIANSLTHAQQCFELSYFNTSQTLSLMSNSVLTYLISTHRKLFYSCPIVF